MTCRKFDREFKMNAVQLTIGADRSHAAVATELGIHPAMLCRWIKEAEKPNPFPDRRHYTRLSRAEVRELINMLKITIPACDDLLNKLEAAERKGR